MAAGVSQIEIARATGHELFVRQDHKVTCLTVDTFQRRKLRTARERNVAKRSIGHYTMIPDVLGSTGLNTSSKLGSIRNSFNA